ncbi:ROK family protein [Streptomyces hokutonensis]|uniref:ROK family transcriptional regulator n=1 Tax=Streptomyces hokutonensis TaxID=1306990 RepID=UPI0036806676
MAVPEPGPQPASVWPLSGAAELVAPGAPAVVGVADLRATNAAAVLAVVRSADPHPRLSELVKATNLSRPTVEVIAEELVDCGLIEVVPALSARGRRSPGRPARRFRFRPDAGFVVGADVRPRSVTVCLADLDGEQVVVERQEVQADLSGAARAAVVTSAVHTAMARVGVDTTRVWAATVGTPGLVDRANTRVRQADNLSTWAGTDIVGILHELLRCPVAVENDANLAALGEQWRGVGRTADGPRSADARTEGGEPSEAQAGERPGSPAGALTGEMVFVLLGERLGAGVITGGRLLRGHHGAAGEIGFIRFPGPSDAPGSPGLEPLPASVVAGTAAGEAEATAAVESYGRRLAEGIAPVLLALDPAVVVLGTGQFGSADTDPAARLLLGAARAHADTLLVDSPRWRLSSLGDDVVLTGAVRFALSSVEVVLRTRPTGLGVRAPGA